MMRVLLGLCLSFSSAVLCAQENWNQFRGPQSLGVSENNQLPDKWSDSENVLWKVPLAGRGWSSPIIWGGKIFLTTVVSDGEAEKYQRGLYFGGNRSKPPQSPHHWKVVCLSLKTGDLLWEHEAHHGKPANPLHIKNSYASETPVTDGERLYAYFGNVGVFCYSLDGRPLWSHRTEPHKTRYDWGTAASPVLHRNRLYIVNDNEEESYLAALDKLSGKQIWRIEREEKSNWSTPFIWENDLRTEIVTPGTGKFRSYDLQGNLLYEFGGGSSITIATPYAYQGLLYLSSGYILDRKKPILALRPGASGEISLEADQESNEHIVWSQKQAAPYNPSTLAYRGRLYVLLDRGFLACYDAKTGTQIYDRKRLPEGRAFTASPWAYNDKVFCLSEYGVTYVVKAGDEFELMHTNALGEECMCMATPAMSGDKLVIRTDTDVYCLQNGASRRTD